MSSRRAVTDSIHIRKDCLSFADLEIAAQYERLSVPERLEQLESELKFGRIGDPVGLIPALDKIIQNERILSYAREHAERLRSQLVVSK